MSLHDDAVDQLERFAPPTAEQAALRSSYLLHLRTHPDGLARGCVPEHVTASLLVVAADRNRVLLNLHGKYGIWTQFGGHCEETDRTLCGAALREGEEESGIADLRLLLAGPVQLSRHEVRCGPVRPSYHLDVRYVAEAPGGAEPVVSEESIDVRWFDRAELPAALEPELAQLVDLAAAL